VWAPQQRQLRRLVGVVGAALRARAPGGAGGARRQPAEQRANGGARVGCGYAPRWLPGEVRPADPWACVPRACPSAPWPSPQLVEALLGRGSPWAAPEQPPTAELPASSPGVTCGAATAPHAALCGLLHVEVALLQYGYGHVEAGRQYLARAGQLLGLEPQVTGAAERASTEAAERHLTRPSSASPWRARSVTALPAAPWGPAGALGVRTVHQQDAKVRNDVAFGPSPAAHP
jgi:hypothetical protein